MCYLPIALSQWINFNGGAIRERHPHLHTQRILVLTKFSLSQWSEKVVFSTFHRIMYVFTRRGRLFTRRIPGEQVKLAHRRRKSKPNHFSHQTYKQLDSAGIYAKVAKGY